MNVIAHHRASGSRRVTGWRAALALVLAAAVGGAFPVTAQEPEKLPATKVEVTENNVKSALPANYEVVPAVVGNPLFKKEKVETLAESLALLRLSEERMIHVNENSKLVIMPSLLKKAPTSLEITKGEIYAHSRSLTWNGSVTSRAVTGDPNGTQFRVKVDDDGTTTFTMLEGQVTLHNAQGTLTLHSMQEAVTKPGGAPVLSSRLDAKTAIQWCLYYPGVLHLSELQIPADEARTVSASLAAYGAGDIPAALRAWPAGYLPRSVGATEFRAMLLLAVGQVDDALPLLVGPAADSAGSRAVRELIHAVILKERVATEPVTASQWLARSYHEQSRGKLEEALAAAKRAREIAPDFGFAAVRVAELEFSFGRNRQAEAQLAEGLALTPRNPQGHALMGFLMAGRNCIDAARTSFESAIAIDPALGNAWLGRGLCSIRQGREEEGYQDLQVAVALEPNRSLLHSYRGKAALQLGMIKPGQDDLDFAVEADQEDPTPWLYAAIELQRQNRTNQAIQALQKSIALNDNRFIYRSGMMLDQDRAVRGANLARIYQSAGLRDLAVREATRAVESDYTNASAHLFLANSFDALRDPARVSLRYETPWSNELLLAHLLSPVGGGPLSQFVSQQEYSKLLEADGLGGSLSSEWRSDGETRNLASLFGTYGQVSFGIDASYRNDNGYRVNSDYELQELYGQLKWQPTADDTFYFLGKWQDQHGGDNFDSYDNRTSASYLDFSEKQQPGLLLAGWNHRWAPKSNTLLLVGRLATSQRNYNQGTRLITGRSGEALNSGFHSGGQFLDPALDAYYPGGQIEADGLGRPVYRPIFLDAIEPFIGSGTLTGLDAAPMKSRSQWEFEIYTAELQQIHTIGDHTLVGGLRWQSGEFESRSLIELDGTPADTGFYFPSRATDEWRVTDFERRDAYLYDYWKLSRCLTVVAGASWHHMEYPDNFRLPPLNDRQREDDGLSGKLGFTYAPCPDFILRGAYAEGLGGVSFDESVRLEPVQLSGFNQAYRSAIPESAAGSVEAPHYKIAGLSAEGRLSETSWWGAALNSIDQDVRRTEGIFTSYQVGFFPNSPLYFADDTPVRLDYREQSALLTLDHLIGNNYAVGAGYRVTRSELRTTYLDLLGGEAFQGQLPQPYPFDSRERATLQELSLHGDCYFANGLFGRLEANLFSQELEDDIRYRTPRRGDEFWQFNAIAGYRFNDNLCEVSAGVLNIGDTDYHLSPLSPRNEIAHRRTAFVRCRLSF